MRIRTIPVQMNLDRDADEDEERLLHEVNDAGIAFRRAEIARTVADPADVEAEVRALFAALAR